MTPVPVSENAEARTMNDAIPSAEAVALFRRRIEGAEFRDVEPGWLEAATLRLADSHEALRSLVADYREALAWAMQYIGTPVRLMDDPDVARARRLLEQENQCRS